MSALHPQHLHADKNMYAEDALFDIYRVMRPGEPPTIDSAQSMFQSLFFDSERYDLSAVGRVKMNMRSNSICADTHRTCARKTFSPSSRRWSICATGKGEIDDIDHLGNRRVRSVGEFDGETSIRIGLLRMEARRSRSACPVSISTP